MSKSNIIYTAILAVEVTVERHHAMLSRYPGTYWVNWINPVGQGCGTEMVFDDFGNLITPRSVGYRWF